MDGVVGMNLIDALLDLSKNSHQPVIAIDGPAGAGKTTLAENIARGFSARKSSTIIHMDDLYDGWDNALSSALLQKIITIVDLHKSERPIRYQRYDWVQGAFSESDELPSRNLLILEGVGSGQRGVEEFLSALIWIDLEPEEGLRRVLNRDGDHIKVQMQKWLKTQQQHFDNEDTKNRADFILTT